MATSVKGTAHHSTQGNGAVRHYKAKAENIVDKLPFLPEKTEEKFNEIATAVSKASKRYLKASRQYIRENPIAGLAVATGVGFIAGSLFSLIVRKRN